MKKITRTEFMKKIKDGERLMEGYDLSDLDLSRINDSTAIHYIRNITFRLCKFICTNFERSDMQHCRFEYCDLSYTNFTLTRNTDSQFKYCCLFGANLKGMNISNGAIINCEMGRVSGFDSACKDSMQFTGSAVI